MLVTRDRLHLRAAVPCDYGAVMALLSEPLDALYPGGLHWLAARLESMPEAGRLTLVSNGAEIVATAIESWKPAGRVKLSTLFVAPKARGRGVGGHLARHLVERWIAEDATEAYVTVASTAVDGLSRVLNPTGFLPMAIEEDRYGPGRHEHVLSWIGRSVRS